MMQRVLSTKSDKEAGWSMWTLAAIVVPGSFTFFSIGTVLYVFSRAFRGTLRATEDQEQRFRQLFEVAPLGYVIHRNGRVLMVNRVAAAGTGSAAPEGMIGMSVYDFLPAGQHETVQEHMGTADAAEPGAILPAELRINDKSGRERLYETSTTPIVLPDGPALFTVLRDVTRAREASVALAAAKELAESANRAKSQFLANMSHEIRTPLNGVLGMADLLRASPLGVEQRRYCDAIAVSGRSLRDLLGDVLDLAKIEADKIELEREDFDLSSLLVDLASSYRELAGTRSNVFAANFNLSQTSRACGDSLRLRQVLGNLLGNAVKFTENGRIEFAAQMLDPRAGDARKWVHFSVRDNGIGMSKETLARLFQPFNQADDSTTRKFGGSGLGLVIAKHLVELMGGTLQVESSLGAGSEFSVRLPFDPARATAQSAADTQEPAVVADALLAVLLVEDNDINQEVARTVLELAGHRVEIAGDGAEAVQKWTRGRFDCVLMDCQMPVMDGYEATRQIRAREAERGGTRVRIIALTASAMAGDRERCLEAGMDDFLLKPFELAALLSIVARNAAQLAPRPEPAAGAASFDPAALAGLLKLDRDAPGFLAKLFGLFLEGAPGHISQVAGVSDDTAVDAERAAHTLKSTSARFGAHALASLAEQAEIAVRAGRIDRARELAEAMRAEFAHASRLLAEHLEGLGFAGSASS